MQQEMIVLDYLSVLEFSGHDAGQFLQGQLTADLAGISPDSARFAACCNPAGRVLGTLLITGENDRMLVICAASLAQTLSDWLARYILRAKVSIVHREDLQVCGLEGTESPDCDYVLFNSVAGRYAALPSASASEQLAQADGKIEAWRSQEVLAGTAWLNTATSAQFLPQMLGMEAIGALSFRKGCYPGQEVIARTHYLGKLKRHPLVCLVDGQLPVEAMNEVELTGGDGAKAVVVDRVHIDRSKTLVLLVARGDGSFEPTSLEAAGMNHAVLWSARPGPDNRLP